MNENQYQQQDDEDESIEFINFLRAEGLRESNQPPPPSPQRKRTFNPKQPFEIATQPEDRPVRKRTSLPAEAERPEPEKPKEEQERKSSRDLSGFPDLPEALAEMGHDYNILCGQLEEMREEEAQAGKSAIREERKALLHHEKLHRETYPAWLRKTFPMLFKRDQDRWPTDWMLKDKRIRERFESDEVFKREIAILNYLWRHRIDDQDKCVELARRIGAGTFQKIETRRRQDKRGRKREEKGPVERDLVFIRPLNFKRIQREFGRGFSEFMIEEHLQESVRVNFLRKFRKAGPNAQMVYAVGYWSPMGKGKFRAEPFLVNSKIFRTALQEFRLSFLRRKPKFRRGSQNLFKF